MARRFNQAWVAGAFEQRKGTSPSCLTGLQVSSSFIGHAAIRNVAIMTSGTTVVSIAAVGVASGDVILALPYMYGAATTVFPSSSATFFVGVVATSVRAGAFELTAIGSRAPTVDCPLAWFTVK